MLLAGMLGSAWPAGAALNYNIKNDSASFLFVNGTSGNVGIGTSEPAALLHVGSGLQSGSADLAANSVLIRGNLEFDGKIYGDGSLLTNLAATTGWSASAGLLYVITSTDNVGIGSSAPSQKLDVAGSARASQIMAGSLTSGRLTYAGTSGLLAGDANVVFDAVNLGIGSTLPMARLNVVDANNPPLMERSALSSDALFTALRMLATKTSSMNNEFGVTLDFTGRNTGAMNNLAQVGAVRNGTDDSGDLVMAASTIGTFNEKMRVTRYGNVGIGTSLPRAHLQVGSGAPSLSLTPALGASDALVRGKLEVDGMTYFNGNIGIATIAPDSLMQVAGSGTSGILFDSAASDVSLGLRSSVANGGIWYIGTGLASAGNVSNYYVRDAYGGGSNMRLVIDSAGNMGVGTITPAAKLHVGTTSSAGLADLSSNSMLVKGNLEVDGKIYGDGSGLTNMAWSMATGKVYTTNAADNVGIGSTSPLARLEIKGVGATSATSSLIVRNSAGSVKVQVQDDGNTGIGTTAPAALLDVNKKFMVFSNGNVGIGTTDPKFLLDAFVPSADATFSHLGLDLSVSTFPKVQFGLNGSYFGYDFSLERMVFNVRAANGYYSITIASQTPSKIRINSMGNVGLSTASPASALSVVGGVSIGNTTYVTAVTAPTNGMIIAGNVGIGTTAPLSSLDVDSLRIRTSGGSGSCNQGDISWNTGNFFVCGTDNAWRHAAGATW